MRIEYSPLVWRWNLPVIEEFLYLFTRHAQLSDVSQIATTLYDSVDNITKRQELYQLTTIRVC